MNTYSIDYEINGSAMDSEEQGCSEGDATSRLAERMIKKHNLTEPPRIYAVTLIGPDGKPSPERTAEPVDQDAKFLESHAPITAGQAKPLLDLVTEIVCKYGQVEATDRLRRLAGLAKTDHPGSYRVAYLSRFSVPAYEVVKANTPEDAAQKVREGHAETFDIGIGDDDSRAFVPIILAVEACEPGGFEPRGWGDQPGKVGP